MLKLFGNIIFYGGKRVQAARHLKFKNLSFFHYYYMAFHMGWTSQRTDGAYSIRVHEFYYPALISEQLHTKKKPENIG